MTSDKYNRLQRLIDKKGKEVEKRVRTKHGEAMKSFEKKGFAPKDMRSHAKRLLAGATMASALLSQPMIPPALASGINLSNVYKKIEDGGSKVNTKVGLHGILPDNRGQLNPWEEGRLNSWLNEKFGLNATSNLDNHRLIHQYGDIGMEQHLIRYPGDSLAQHDSLREAGMAPQPGAWGYFASAKSQMTKEDYLREKYYVAVQTLYLPEWKEDYTELKKWYKYRKVLVINPENESAVVAVIADAGPAKWTGKVFGGSPELMYALGLSEGGRKGKVVLLFVDDPADDVPLGPLIHKL